MRSIEAPRGGVASGRASIAIEASRAAAAAAGAANGAAWRRPSRRGHVQRRRHRERRGRGRRPGRHGGAAAGAGGQRRQRRRQGRGRVERVGPRCQGGGRGRGRHPRFGRRQPGVHPDRVRPGSTIWRTRSAPLGVMIIVRLQPRGRDRVGRGFACRVQPAGSGAAFSRSARSSRLPLPPPRAAPPPPRTGAGFSRCSSSWARVGRPSRFALVLVDGVGLLALLQPLRIISNKQRIRRDGRRDHGRPPF